MKKLFLLSLLFFNFLILSSPAGACDSDCQSDITKFWQEETTTTTPVTTIDIVSATSTVLVPQKKQSPQITVLPPVTLNSTTTTTTAVVFEETINISENKSSIVYPGYYEYCRATQTCANHIYSNSSSHDSFSFFSYHPAVILLWAIFSFLLFMLVNNTIKYSFMYKYGYRTWFQRIFNHN